MSLRQRSLSVSEATAGAAAIVATMAYVLVLAARHAAGERHAERLWMLVNFETWQRRFFDGEAPDAASAAIQEFSFSGSSGKRQ